jgi:uncharacterized protein (DUF302 family)
MSARILRTASAVLFAFALTATSAAVGKAEDGIVKVKSAYPVGETIERLKQDIAAKGIRFFSAIDQSKLAANTGVTLRPSTLLVFGNPPLGTLFLTSNPHAGLDWPPVRLLVIEDEKGDVYAVYTDFDWIAKRPASRTARRSSTPPTRSWPRSPRAFGRSSRAADTRAARSCVVTVIRRAKFVM